MNGYNRDILSSYPYTLLRTTKLHNVATRSLACQVVYLSAYCCGVLGIQEKFDHIFILRKSGVMVPSEKCFKFFWLENLPIWTLENSLTTPLHHYLNCWGRISCAPSASNSNDFHWQLVSYMLISNPGYFVRKRRLMCLTNANSYPQVSSRW